MFQSDYPNRFLASILVHVGCTKPLTLNSMYENQEITGVDASYTGLGIPAMHPCMDTPFLKRGGRLLIHTIFLFNLKPKMLSQDPPSDQERC